MSWQGQMGTIVRHLINDLEDKNYKFTDQRVETSILVAAQLTIMNVDFVNTYDINVESCLLSPDPTDSDTKDNVFITLVCLRAACIIVGSEIRSESGNAISIKDGPSAIDLSGVSQTLIVLYKDLCAKYDKLLMEYKAGSGSVGQAILGPYSPGSDMVTRDTDYRAGGFFYY